MEKRKKPVEFHYTFTFADGSAKQFDVHLDPTSLALQEMPHKALPQWARLDYRQCPQCTLTEDMTPWCPVAANLVDVIEEFKDVVSFEEATVRIETPDRTYEKHTAIQKGVSSLMGIYTVSCGCPVFNALRPMVRFHLPFASIEETMYRVVSMYLVQQYFRMRREQEPDWAMQGLAEVYREIHEVNNAFMERLEGLSLKDSNINALVILDIFSSFMTFSLETDNLSKIAYLFND